MTDTPTLPQKVKDLSGQRFGQLTVIKWHGRRKHGQSLWLCRCDCGNDKIADGNKLKEGRTDNCGCITSEKRKAAATKHGLGHSRELKIWDAMIYRCHSPKYRLYHDYGGRGISVCQEWRDSFLAFYNHMGARPSPKHELDRIDNNGNYEPGNVRWVTRLENARNKRNNVFIEYCGERKTLSQWSAVLGISSGSLSRRIKNWPIEKALTAPARGARRQTTSLHQHTSDEPHSKES